MARYEAEQTNQLALLKRQMLEKRSLLSKARQAGKLDTVSAAVTEITGIRSTGFYRESSKQRLLMSFVRNSQETLKACKRSAPRWRPVGKSQRRNINWKQSEVFWRF